MAEALAISLRDHPDVQELLELLQESAFNSQRQEYESLLDGVDTIIKRYDNILMELSTLKEKVSQITDKKNPLAVMVENLENLASGIGTKLQNLKDGILTFTKSTLDAVKEKGLSALGSVFNVLHVKDGLQAMSRGLEKSVESLDKTIARVDSLEQHTREKAAVLENSEVIPSAEEQSVSLAELLADTRVDFENMSQDELKAVYAKLLAIGMDNDLTANENICLQNLVDEIGDMLPDHGEYEPAQELEIGAEQGAVM